jgi:hypothetical protein
VRVARWVILALLLAVAAIVWLIDSLSLDVDVLLEYLLGSALLVLAAGVAAGVVVVVVRVFRG